MEYVLIIIILLSFVTLKPSYLGIFKSISIHNITSKSNMKTIRAILLVSLILSMIYFIFKPQIHGLWVDKIEGMTEQSESDVNKAGKEHAAAYAATKTAGKEHATAYAATKTAGKEHATAYAATPAPSENNSDIIKQPTLTKGLTVENVTPSPVYYEPGTRIYGGLGYSPSHSDIANMNNKLTSKLEEVDNSDNRGFCAMSGNTMVNIDEKCRTLSNDVCASTDCCVLLGNEKCVQGDIHGPTKKGVYSDTTIKNRDHYYYIGKCYGNC